MRVECKNFVAGIEWQEISIGWKIIKCAPILAWTKKTRNTPYTIKNYFEKKNCKVQLIPL